MSSPIISAKSGIAPEPVGSTSTVGEPELTAGTLTITIGPVPSTSFVGSPVLVPAALGIFPELVPATGSVGSPTLIGRTPGAAVVLARGTARIVTGDPAALVFEPTPRVVTTTSPEGVIVQ
ncbi:MAG: hypothetical protein ABW022_16035 [Actinoplanes sp.]